MRFLRRFQRDERGSIALLAAAGGLMMIGCAAVAVDMGSVYAESRKLQGVADLAAMAAARDLDRATVAAQATVTANNWPGVTLDVKTGVHRAQTNIPVAQRFTPGGADPNAVRVELTAQASLYFGQVLMGKPTITIRRKATAARAQLASFSVGSRLASLNGGIANSLLSALGGSQLSLSVMDYNALAGTKVDLLTYVDALRTSANLQAASFDQALAVKVTPGDALSTLSNLLTSQGETQAATAVHKIAVSAKGLAPVDLTTLIDLGPVGEQDKLVSVGQTKVSVAAMDMANALLLLADGGRQVKLDLGAQLPGLLDVDVWLAIGERPNNSPWLSLNDKGQTVVRTSQARLYIKAKAASVLAVAGLQPITLPVFVELASAEARLDQVTCPANSSDHRVTLKVKPSLGKVVIGDVEENKLNDFKHDLAIEPGTILDIALIKITGSAEVKLGGDAAQTVNFNRAEIAAGVVKSVKTTDLATASLTSLISKTQISAKIAGLNVPLLSGSVLSALPTLGGPVDDLINGLTELLGVRLGEADVQVHGLRCRDAVLVA